MRDETTTSLLRAIRSEEDEDAWRRFCDRFKPLLCAVICRAGLPADITPDVVQEILLAFTTAYREGKYDPQKGRLRSWLCGIAMNKIRETRRRLRHAEKQIVADDGKTDLIHRIPDERELTDIFEREWEKQILDLCFRRVQREVDRQTWESFRLYAMEDWPAERVAEHLGIKRSSVYVNKNRVLSRLRHAREELSDDA